MIISPSEFNFKWFRKLPSERRKAGNQGTKHQHTYVRLITAFDIETTAIDNEQSIMYIWQWQFGDYCTVIGRTWKEFNDFREMLKMHLKGRYLVVYVHNLSYEFQFLRGIYHFETDEVFAIQPRKILKCNMDEALEFRCSYLHSNMSLSEYTKKMGAEHQKLSGDEFDYSKKRYPWTQLTDRELEYCINDVLGLVEALTIEMKVDNDNLYSIPLTSTGYIRRRVKRAMKEISHEFVSKQCPDYELYKLLRMAFRGGNTHGNRFYAGKIINNVSSADRSSSYPEVICNCEFPIRPFFHEGPIEFDRLMQLIRIRKKAVIMRVAFRNLRLHYKWWGCPYLSKDKCDTFSGQFDNGRILSAGYCETILTDVDLNIVLQEYDFDDIEILDCYTSSYGKLPKPLIETVCRLYEDKTTLKGDKDKEILYSKSKALLNSTYGMMAQDPIKQTIDFVLGEFVEQSLDPAELLVKHNKTAFLAYQWGVWTTAWARWMLEEGIKLAGPNFIYCDTDSVKYTGEIDWTEFNNGRIKASKRSGAYATDSKGNTHYMRVFEFEEVYDRFSTLGAKKYVSETDGKLHVTIAGVNKKKGAKELGRIENFKQGFIFKDAGGSELIYNDDVYIPTIIDGHELIITSNVYIKDSTYTIGLTHEYLKLIERVQLPLDIVSQ